MPVTRCLDIPPSIQKKYSMRPWAGHSKAGEVGRGVYPSGFTCAASYAASPTSIGKQRAKRGRPPRRKRSSHRQVTMMQDPENPIESQAIDHEIARAIWELFKD